MKTKFKIIAQILLTIIMVIGLSANCWASGQSMGTLFFVDKDGATPLKFSTLFSEVKIYHPTTYTQQGETNVWSASTTDEPCVTLTALDITEIDVGSGAKFTKNKCKGNITRVDLKVTKTGGTVTLTNGQGFADIKDLDGPDESKTNTCGGYLIKDDVSGLKWSGSCKITLPTTLIR